MLRKFTAIIITCVLFILPFGVCALGAEGKTALYINYGSIIIGEDSITGYDYYGGVINAVNADGYVIRQNNNRISTDNTVIINAGNTDITLDGVNIDCSKSFGKAPVYVSQGVSVNLTLKRNNYISCGDCRAALEIPSGSSVVIDGEGSLYAQSKFGTAAVGGSNTDSGSITINSGYITADCRNSSSGAGIGGGSNTSSSDITINGGCVTAYGGDYSAGIGGGGTGGNAGSVAINGGTVTSVGGSYAAGIGGGIYGNCGSIIINGGSVKAIPGNNCANVFGAGYGGGAYQPVDSLNHTLYKVTVPINTENGAVRCILNNNDTGTVCPHPDDGNLYFYLPSGTYSGTLETLNSSLRFIGFNVNGENPPVSITQSERLILKNESDLILNNKLLRGDFAGIENIKSEFENENLILIDAGGESVNLFSVYKTGQKVYVYENGIVTDFAEIVLRGDADCDGLCDARDSVIADCVAKGLLTREQSGEAVYSACDADSDGNVNREDTVYLIKTGVLI